MADPVFAGKVALVTGGTRGIGRAAALRLASEGARMAISYVANTAAADRTVGEIEATGGTVLAVKADVSRPQDVQRMVDQVRRSFGPIEMLVHSAGISIVEPASLVSWETWRRTMDVNLDGTFHVVYAVKDEMIAREFGRVVLTVLDCGPART